MLTKIIDKTRRKERNLCLVVLTMWINNNSKELKKKTSYQSLAGGSSSVLGIIEVKKLYKRARPPRETLFREGGSVDALQPYRSIPLSNKGSQAQLLGLRVSIGCKEKYIKKFFFRYQKKETLNKSYSYILFLESGVPWVPKYLYVAQFLPATQRRHDRGTQPSHSPQPRNV